MNFTVFSNVSGLLVRSLNLIKFRKQTPLAIRTIYYHYVQVPQTQFQIANENHNSRSPRIRPKKQWQLYDDRRWSRRDQSNDGDGSRSGAGCVVSAAFLFNLFGMGKEKNDDGEEETPEDKLIKTIKRSMLCIQREQYEVAERMLHLALRMAQDIRSREGITFVYDVMANLAMEREQYKKADKLFADVMKRLLADGHTESSPQILHISAKLAHMAQLQGDLEKALQGFVWTLKLIEENVRKMPEDKDIRELLGLTKNWFGQLLVKQGKYLEAKKHFQDAYDCFVELYGRVNEESVTILNNLSVACVNLEDFEQAKAYLNEALGLVKELKDTAQEGLLQANMGLIYLREGLISKARDTCKLAYRMAKRSKNIDAMEQSEYCLNELKSFGI